MTQEFKAYLGTNLVGNLEAKAPTNPCVRNCCLNEKNICLGCYRSLDEILQWSKMDSSTRVEVLSRCHRRRSEKKKTTLEKIGVFQASTE